MRVTHKTHPAYFRWPHAKLSTLEKLVGFRVRDDDYVKYRREAEEACPEMTREERDAWAAHIARTHPGFHSHATPEKHQEQGFHRRHAHVTAANFVLLIVVIVLLFLLLVRPSKAEPNPNLHYRYTRNEVAATFGMGDGITPIYPFQFDASNFLKVNCITGCSATSGFTDNSAYTVGTSTINVIGAYFTSGADPACTTGNACRMRVDASSNLRVNCIVGCAGGSTTPADTFTNPATAGLQFDLLAGFDGTTWDRLRSSIANGLQVDVTRVQGNVAVTGTFFQATQPVSCTAANCAINEAQVAGTAKSVNNGTTDAGTTRVTLSSDSTGQVKTTNFPATVDTNTGNASPSTPRVVLATNQPAVPVTGDTNGCDGATGSAVPAKGCYTGSNQDGNLAGIITCIHYAKDRSTTADVQLVAASGTTTIYICGYSISGESSTASDVNFRYADSASCTTNPVDITPPVTIQAAASVGPIGKVIPPGIWSGLKTAATGKQVCAHRSAAQQTEVELWYGQF
jgi:hypothetical protein